MKIRTVKTLVKKDLKYCLTNGNLLFSAAIPMLFCVLYRFLLSNIVGIGSAFVLQMCAIMAITMVPTTILPVMIAEEKEKYTLRSLILAQVSGMEFLLGKLITGIVLTLIDAAVIFAVAGGNVSCFGIYMGMVVFSAAGLSFLGAVVGLTAKDQTSAGTLGAPLMIVTLVPPLFAGLNKTLETLSALVPTTSFQTVYLSVTSGNGLVNSENLTAFAVCAVWVIAGYGVFHWFYKQRGMDY